MQKVFASQTGYFPKRAEPFSFRFAEFASFFAGRKAEQTFCTDFYTPCDSSFIRTNRTWLIAKTARCARSFCDDYNRHNGYSCFHNCYIPFCMGGFCFKMKGLRLSVFWQPMLLR